jgi:hypothetical protein
MVLFVRYPTPVRTRSRLLISALAIATRVTAHLPSPSSTLNAAPAALLSTTTTPPKVLPVPPVPPVLPAAVAQMRTKTLSPMGTRPRPPTLPASGLPTVQAMMTRIPLALPLSLLIAPATQSLVLPPATPRSLMLPLTLSDLLLPFSVLSPLFLPCKKCMTQRKVMDEYRSSKMGVCEKVAPRMMLSLQS